MFDLKSCKIVAFWEHTNQ